MEGRHLSAGVVKARLSIGLLKEGITTTGTAILPCISKAVFPFIQIRSDWDVHLNPIL